MAMTATLLAYTGGTRAAAHRGQAAFRPHPADSHLPRYVAAHDEGSACLPLPDARSPWAGVVRSRLRRIELAALQA
jgi:hypothetical protein